jgi:hypothetical protein
MEMTANALNTRGTKPSTHLLWQGGVDGDDDDDWDAFQEPLPEGSVNLPRGSEPSQAHLKPASGASPWAMLDPHDASGANPRPFRRGKTSRRPKKESTQGYEPRANLGGLQTRSIKLPAFQDFMPLFIEQRNKVSVLLELESSQFGVVS